MAYTALYRKWRPLKFEDVRGQQHIVKTLKNQMNSGRIGHAYLFTGTRGTGKTTIAKIFARAVNCEHPVNGSPCNECETCKKILSGASMNVIEIDAASNNGVDNIREIREEVKYSPTEGRYKVYIIDEVHMLSAGAFNALLKTLEEPPEYVIFILATTDVQRIPITVLSRCQRYDFKRLKLEELKSQIRDLLKAENIEADEEAVGYIARKADGSSRDGLSLLEECISFNFGEVLTYERVLEVLGAVDQKVFSDLLKAILSYDVRGVVSLIDDLLSSGRELSQFVQDFTWYLRNLLLIQTDNPGEDILGVSKEDLILMQEEAVKMDINQCMRYIRILSALSNEMKFAVSKRVVLEIGLMKMMQPAMEEDLESLKDRIRALEEHGTGIIGESSGRREMRTGAASDPAGSQGNTPEKPTAEVKPVEVPQAVFDDYRMITKDWSEIVNSQERLMRSLLQETQVSASNNGIEILFKDPFTLAVIEKSDRKKEIQEILKNRYEKEFRLNLKAVKPEETAPRIVPGKRIPGIDMDIDIEE